MWMVGMRWSNRVLGLINIAVLARLLSPADFGLIAMAMVVIGFLNVLTNVGIDLAIIRHPDPKRHHYDTAFTFNFLLHLGLGLLVWALAAVAARYFNEPRLLPIMTLLAVVPVIRGLENIGVADFRRNLEFGRDFQFDVISRLVGFVFTLTLAFLLRNYWVLAIGMIAHVSIRTAYSYIVHPYRPRFSFAAFQEIAGFSLWIFVRTMSQYLNRKGDEIIIGRLVNTAGFGLYSTAANIAVMLTSELVTPLGRALMPGYVKVMDEPQKLRGSFYKVLGVHAIIATSVGFGLAVVAEDFIRVVLGDRWLAALPFMVILAVASAAEGIGAAIAPLSVALDKVKQIALFRWAQLGVLVVAFALAAKFGGVEQIALARAGVTIVAIPAALYVIAHSWHGARRVMTGALIRPLLAGLVMMAVVKAAHLDGLDLPLVTLTMDAALGLVVYGLALLGVWQLAGRPKGMEDDVFSRLFAIVANRRRPPAPAGPGA